MIPCILHRSSGDDDTFHHSLTTFDLTFLDQKTAEQSNNQYLADVWSTGRFRRHSLCAFINLTIFAPFVSFQVRSLFLFTSLHTLQSMNRRSSSKFFFPIFESLLVSFIQGNYCCGICNNRTNQRLIQFRKMSLFTSELNIELRKKLISCYVRSIALYDSETGH